MFEKPTRLIVIVAATLALAACQQQSKDNEQAPAAAQPAPMSAPANETNTSETQAAGPAMTAEPSKPAGPAMTAEPSGSSAMKPAATEPAPATGSTMTPTTEAKPSAPAPAPEPSAAMIAEPAAPAPKPAAAPATAETFNTTKCKACHAIDQDKVGPAWKTVVEKYGDAATLARDFESGFKERRVANSIAKWKSKEVLMTSQYRSLIKGHEKAVAHALFESVRQGKFGNY